VLAVTKVALLLRLVLERLIKVLLEVQVAEVLVMVLAVAVELALLVLTELHPLAEMVV
jgi:hypothetical protein